MEGMDLGRALAVATSLAVQAGGALRGEFHRSGGPRGDGGHADVDADIEQRIRSELLREFEGTNYVGAQTGVHSNGASSPTWFVTANDSPRAFLRGFRSVAVSIGLVVDGEPVLGVVYAPFAPDDAGDLITWAQGEPVRRNGVAVSVEPLKNRLEPLDVVFVSHDADSNSQANATACAPARFRAIAGAAYRGALVAVGEGEAFVSLEGPVPWLLAGAHALLRAVGGELVGRDGRAMRYGGDGAGGLVVGAQPDVATALAARNWQDCVRPEARRRELRISLLEPNKRLTVDDSARLARAQGCLLGQVAGDALGALVEFQTADGIRLVYPEGVRELANGGPHGIAAGQPTDDSEMALVFARTLISRGGFDAFRMLDAYRAWGETKPFDIGFTVRRALAGRRDEHSQANGALMRISPLGIFGASLADDEIARIAREDALLTHPHPVCQDASAVYALAIAHAVRSGGTGKDVYAYARDWAHRNSVEIEVRTALENAQHGRPADFQQHMGWVLIALQEAFYELLHAHDLEEGVVRTVAAGGDTDTNAAITGALLGAVYGRDALPMQWRRAVLSCRTLGPRHDRPKALWAVDALWLAEALLGLGLEQARA